MKIHLISLATAMLLSACGGGGGGGGGGVATTPDATPVLTGVVAVGAALPSVTVTVTDAKGVEATAVTKDDGTYSVFDPSGGSLVAPFSIKIVTQLGTSEIKLNSFALERGLTANVTPLTTAVSSLLNVSNNYDPTTLNPATVTTQDLNTAIASLKTALTPLLTNAGVSTSTFDPIKGTFAANSSGIDAVLDSIAITYTSTGLTLSNRFELSTDGSDATTITINAFGVKGGTLPVGVTSPTLVTLSGFTAKLAKCFSLSTKTRVGFTTNAGGRDIYTSGTIHSDCEVFVDKAYKSQGQGFGQRWLSYLSNADFDSTTKFILVPQFTVDKSADSNWPGGVAYVYSINMIDKNGLTYTMPDVLAKVNGEFVLMGNQRNYDIAVQPVISKVNDNNGTNNYVEGRLRIALDPTLVNGTYNYSATDASKPLPKILCAWVTGPLLQNGVTHDPENPKGGVLMVPPHSDLVPRREYSAIHIKYPTNFDPIKEASHRRTLLEDCRSVRGTSPNYEIATNSTSNNFAIDKAKTSADSTATFNAYSLLGSTVAYPTSIGALNNASQPVNVSTNPYVRLSSCPTSTSANGSTKDTVNGFCYPSVREDYVSSTDVSTFNSKYKDPKDIFFTFYVFVDSNYSAATPTVAYAQSNDKKTSYACSGTTTTSCPLANVDAFFASADIVKNVRIVGSMPFLTKIKDSSNNIIYSGNEVFRSVGQSMISTYLADKAPTVLKGALVPASWTIPAGAEGLDRIGLGGWFVKSNGDRIGLATYNDSFPLPRKLLSKDLTLLEDWYGYDIATYKNGSFASTASKTYREVWIRSYDRYNRQIQTVENAYR